MPAPDTSGIPAAVAAAKAADLAVLFLGADQVQLARCSLRGASQLLLMAPGCGSCSGSGSVGTAA